ncbi:unnamed protein product, partial [Mesorhabditis spiculigera]
MLFWFMLAVGYVAGQDRVCSGQPELGNTTNGVKPEIRYWFDSERMECFPFLYKGSCGNGNRYTTSGDCYSACMPLDYSSCGFGIENVGLCATFEQRECASKDAVCHMGAFFGFCCPKAAMDRANNPKCPNAKTVVKQADSTTWTLMGRKCSHQFCPSGSTCVDGEFYAYCCK